MRSLVPVLVLSLLAVALAGCVADETPDPDTPPRDGARPPQDDPDDPRLPTEGAPTPTPSPGETQTFCTDAASCDFWDDQYHEYVLYQPDTVRLDVLIVPPGTPDPARDTAVMRHAVQAWADGIAAQGAPWFASNLTVRIYVIGEDTPPQEAIDDPEILVVGAEYNPFLLFGIGLESPLDVCRDRGGTAATFADHVHDGMRIRAESCEEGGFTCVALNTNFLLGGPNRMHDLVAHEFGHCLGAGHVGDALDFRAKTVPVHDIMSYQYDPDQVHCVSNLNVRVLEGIYGPLLGRPAIERLRAGDFYTMDPADYEQVRCANPPT